MSEKAVLLRLFGGRTLSHLDLELIELKEINPDLTLWFRYPLKASVEPIPTVVPKWKGYLFRIAVAENEFVHILAQLPIKSGTFQDWLPLIEMKLAENKLDEEQLHWLNICKENQLDLLKRVVLSRIMYLANQLIS